MGTLRVEVRPAMSSDEAEAQPEAAESEEEAGEGAEIGV